MSAYLFKSSRHVSGWFSNFVRGGRRMAFVAISGTAVGFGSAIASAQQIVYVDALNGSPTGDCTSWTTACQFLQDGLAAAAAHNPTSQNSVEIWVAQGTYRPDQNKNNKDPNHPDTNMLCDPELEGDCCPPYGNCDTTAVFEMLNNVRIFGGFVGTEATRDERRPLENITTLNGVLKVGQHATTHSRNIVLSDGNNATARLDGFHIVGAIGEVGGAVLLLDGSFILSNCHLYDNIAWWGAGIYVFRGAPSIINCVIRDNECNFGRGAVFITDGHETFVDQVHATLVNCLIHNNIGSSSGENHPLGIGVAITSCNVLPGIDWRRVIGPRIEQ